MAPHTPPFGYNVYDVSPPPSSSDFGTYEGIAGPVIQPVELIEEIHKPEMIQLDDIIDPQDVLFDSHEVLEKVEVHVP